MMRTRQGHLVEIAKLDGTAAVNLHVLLSDYDQPEHLSQLNGASDNRLSIPGPKYL